ncbi:MAG TPA: hypothetical protein VG758_24495 [Hyphomicrobiaceae bacterium]|jgi:hypothetical protein|nr:hypothetical protein [Hyphomicrobiaceae bacterium]
MRAQTGRTFAVVQALLGRAGLAQAWRKLIGDSYRPEKHYMRGPGPKVREKYARAVARRPSNGAPSR